MNNLGAFVPRATGTAKSLSLLTMVGLAGPVTSKSRWAGLTGANPEARTTWIHVGYEGEWSGHPSGPFKLTAEDFAACAAAISNRKTPPQVDYGHGSLYESDGEPKPAAGYVLSVETRGDDLWAEVEFTERAAGMVKAGEYRFCSGVFVWDAPDRVTSDPIPCQLDSIGLTNRPFVEGQQAIRLTAVVGASMDFKKADIVAKLDALVEGDSVSDAQLDAFVSFLKDSEAKPEPAEVEMADKPKDEKIVPPVPPVEEKAKAASAPVPLAEPPVDVMVEPAGDVADLLISKLAELTGLDNASIVASLDANADQIKAAFLGGDGGTLPMQALAAKVPILETTVAALSVKLGKYEADDAKRADDAIASEVETLIQSGKAHPAQRETWTAMARKTPAEFRALASKLPVAFPLGREAPVNAPPSNPESLGTIDPDAMPKTHPKYVQLSAKYSDPKSPYARMLPTAAAEREAAIDRMVRNEIRKSQPISG